MGRRYLVWFWSGGGGGSQFAVRLAHRLGERFGAGNVVASLRSDDPTTEWAAERGVKVLKADIVSDRKRPLRTLTDLNKGAQVLREHIRIAKADAVILAMNFAAAAPLSATLDTPLIYCAHDPRPHEGDYAVRLQSVTQSFLLQRAAKIVALSNFGAGQLRAQGIDPHKIVTLPLASVFDPRSRVARPPHTYVRFLFMGRMIAYKGLETLADALRMISHRRDWRLQIAGKGPALDAKMIERLASPQVDIVSRDWMNHDQIDDLLRSNDVLLAPYREATQSGVVADALTWGVPAVSTQVGALSEQLGDGKAGWLIPDQSPTAFADAMLAVCENRQELAAKSAAALALAEKTWAADSWGWLAGAPLGQAASPRGARASADAQRLYQRTSHLF